MQVLDHSSDAAADDLAPSWVSAARVVTLLAQAVLFHRCVTLFLEGIAP